MFGLSWPIAMNAILLQSILVIDTMLVAPLGERALAAMGLATTLGTLVVGMLFAFSSATQLLVAQAEGAGSPLHLKGTFRAGLVVNLAIGAVGIALVFVAGRPTLEWLSSEPALASAAWDYLAWFALVIAGVAISQHVTATLNATGRSRLPFYSNLLELPVNAAASAALIHGAGPLPALGLSGAAIGSSLAVGLRAAFLLIALHRTRQPFLSATGWAEDGWPGALRRHWRNATPIAATFVSAVASMQVCMMIWAQLPIAQFALLTLLLPWMKLFNNAITAWAQGTGILVGQLLGRDEREYLDRFVLRSWRSCLVIAIVVSLLYVVLCATIDKAYPGLQPDTLALLGALAPWLIALPLIRFSNTMCGNVLRAGGDAPYSLKVHAGTQWLVTVPLSAVFVLWLELSVVSVFAVLLIDELVKALPFHLRMLTGRWKRRLIA